MKLLSALLDLTLLPVSIATDIVRGPVDIGIYGRKSQTRQRLEKIEEELAP